MTPMILRDVTQFDLKQLFKRYKKHSSIPHILAPDAKGNARRNAKASGLWDYLSTDFDPTATIPVVPRSSFRQFKRNGNRTVHQNQHFGRKNRTSEALMALFIDHPKASLDYAQDLLWASCDEHTWVMPAHEGAGIDLGSSGMCVSYAEWMVALEDVLEEEVITRVHQRIRERALDLFLEPGGEFWRTGSNNWNHVCHSNIIRTALLMCDDLDEKANIIHTAVNNMTYAVDGFFDDGGCDEGPGYWCYGFGHYVLAAAALRNATAGKLNIMQDPKIERICRFPLAAHIHDNHFTAFSDAGHGYLQPLVMMQINEFYDLPELYSLCRRDNKRRIDYKRDNRMYVTGLHQYTLYDGKPLGPSAAPTNDAHLPDMHLAKIRSKAGRQQATVVALAAHNAVSHNHNDTGSFTYYRHGQFFLDDPGAPEYSKDTFNQNRYKSLFTNAMGHNLPIINGVLQPEGRQYAGTMAVNGLNEAGDKSITMNLTKAWPKGTVKRYTRELTLDHASHALTLCDKFTFDKKPRKLVENFVTFLKPTLQRGGQAVVIKGDKGNKQSVTLQAVDTPGTFSLEVMTEASKEGKTDRIITRILFTPKTRSKDMTLRFEVS